MKRILLSFILLLFLSLSVTAQQNPWKKVSLDHQPASILRSGQKADGYRLELNTLQKNLGTTPGMRTTLQGKGKKIVSFPVKDGAIEDFEVTEIRFLPEKLSQKYPGIRSYSGRSMANPQTEIRFSMDDFGFHGVIHDKAGTYYINPDDQNKDIYFLASRQSFSPYAREFECMAKEEARVMGLKSSITQRGPDDGQMRTFRLALACTGEFAQYHINAAGVNNGTNAQKKAAVLSAMNTIMTRVNGIYERDLSLTMQLIDNNDELIFLDPDTDGMTNNAGRTLIDEIQPVIDNLIGTGNYDIGHVFSTGAGGIAQLNSPCTASKAMGVTGTSSPVGDPFTIDYVAHEMGHQFGATHTFNNNCGGERSNGTAVEPGSGSTIMAYAGICPPNVQNNSDPYFHAVSIAQIWENITEGNSTCATLENTGNRAPSADAGADYVIPAGTPFMLSGTASDPDGDALSYNWEQTDNQIYEGYPEASSAGGPVFRSYSPNGEPIRYFPRLNDILSGELANTWEVLPSVQRELNFSFLVRDNNPAGGQTARDDVHITVNNDAGPFIITSHQNTKTMTGGNTETVTWDVAGTHTGAVSAELVDILLSADNSFKDPVILASGVPNNGSATVIVPGGISTSQARIMVKPQGNIFFSVNTADLTIEPSGFMLDFESLSEKICLPDEAVYNFVYRTYEGFNHETVFTAEVPAGLNATFTPASATADGTTVEIKITGISATGEYAVKAEGTSGGQTLDIPLLLEVYDQDFENVVLSAPANGAEELRPSFGITLEWEESPNAEAYDIQLSGQSDFSTILETASVAFPYFEPETLENDHTYYWRVKPKNPCGEGEYSNAFSFRTLETQCKTYVSGEPVDIPANRASTVTSSLAITDDDIITGGISLSLDITHTYISDLTVSLTSPAGTTVRILSGICDEAQNINAVFSTTGESVTCNNNPAVSGTVRPVEPLTLFRGESMQGTWTLTVEDSYAEDGGTINSFGITRCSSPAADNFRVKITDESCKDTKDGIIDVQAEIALNYQVKFSGNNTDITESFTDSWQATNLSPGSYQLCFTIEDNPVYMQCFDVAVAPSGDLSVYSEVSATGNTVNLRLDGGALYTVELNGTRMETTENNVALNLRSGKNTIVIKTDKPCQGVYEEEIYIAPDDVVIYPNPFSDSASAYLGSNISGELHISVYSLSGRLITSLSHTDARKHIDLGLHSFPPGVYLVKIKGKDIRKTSKIVKR
ncbi:T9SS C-terminal target domain-containing protein [Sinomicrobium pectinilyticum]|uniref:T9SS C-terminal target domain-containing protein n=1 Tax=Sinomicrobium pectinilyticum TaxID=1084421 RepID=A0A3N0EZS6_SINP1|nr:zinc-dependent metalloprotease family protein [Sinomicrobium pectinilyticum]RNL93428.1 T9SS C-terminal target domain-containing protein [Sinomicrobium pectinilyticum]